MNSLAPLPPYKSRSIVSPPEKLVVMNGQNTKIPQFTVHNPESFSCRVQVLDEPHFGRAGTIFPQLFDCDFSRVSQSNLNRGWAKGRVDPDRNPWFRAWSGLENRDSRVPDRVRDRPLGSGIPGKPGFFRAKFVFQEKVAKY